MFEGMLFYIFVCLAFFAIGDFLGVATKAKLSSVFVSLLLFLVFFMADWIPDDVINQAGLTQIGKWAVGFVVFGMGTTINMRELIAEWRTVATACLSMAVIWIGMGFAYQSIHSARPFRDSITDATNGVGQLLMTRLYREQWIFWIATNVFSIYLWWDQSLHIQGMYWVYTLNSLVGWYQWTKALKKEVV